MKPLSPWLYFRRNWARTLPVFGIIALSVLGVLVVGILAHTQMDTPRETWIDPAKTYALITPRKGTLDPNIAARLRTHPDVDKVVRLTMVNVRGTTLMGSEGFPVPALQEKEIEWYMQATGMQLLEGRLPQGSRPEILLHTALMNSKSVQIGDVVGRDADPDEWLPGKFTIVGRIDGPIQMGITTASAMRTFAYLAERYEVFAKPGRMAALDPYLRLLRSDDVDVNSMSVMTERFETEIAFVDPMLNSINGITIFVLSLAVGLLNQIYFQQRVPEYGILLAMGYRVGFLVRRTLVEALTMTIVGWLVGLGGSYAVNWALRAYVFGPKGLKLSAISPEIAATTLPIPILIGVFSLYTVIKRLVTMDAVAIVERRD